MLILAADYLIGPGDGLPSHHAVLIAEGLIGAVGPLDDLCKAYPQSTITMLPGCVLMPGLVNAHQHGRGISQMLMGYHDDALEPWIAGRALHGAPDIYAVTRLAAESMIANGVTACVHANYTYATGNYASEIEETVRAYRDSGIRATVCVGYQDRGFDVYPMSAGLGDVDYQQGALRYAGNVDQTIDLLDQLRERYRDCSRLTFALGPAGPQWVSDDAWRQLADHSARTGTGLHFHLLESPAQAVSCHALWGDSTLLHLQRLGVFEARTSCAHGVFMSDVDMAVACTEGLVIAVNPGANMRLFNGPPPLIAMLDAGCTLAVGTDNTSTSDDEDYLRELRLVQLLARHPGVDTKGPDADQMLLLATRNGARAGFLGSSGGSVEVGAPADLVAINLSRITSDLPVNPGSLTDLLVGRGRGADIAMTMVGGQALYQAGQLDKDRLSYWRDKAIRSVQDRICHDALMIRKDQMHLRRYYRSTLG